MRPSHYLFLLVLLNTLLSAEKIDTFYGSIEVEEPVILELIKSPALQRLKSIHQYGVAYYTTHREEYNRYDHSIGVFALLRLKGACLEEQISGLLHDVSHTVFSHVGDWVFGKEYQDDDYQTTIHKIYLAVSGIEEILQKHGYTIDNVLPKGKGFLLLEQPLPNLSADRIDYNLQGAYFQNFLKHEEVLELFEDFRFENGKWTATRTDLLTKLARFSLFMTENCWGSATNYVTSRWLADAILHGLKTGLISWKELHFGIDQEVWDKLQRTQDPFIVKRMEMVAHPDSYYHHVTPSQANLFVKFRCRGVDPWIRCGTESVRLTSLDPKLEEELFTLKDSASKGWPILIN